MEDVKYNFYATLLDSFQNYLDSETIYDKYWGFSENPPCTCEEFRQEQFHSLIGRINRVSFDNEAADKGTAFNEVIDCMVLHKKSDKVDIAKVYDDVKVTGVNATIGERTFFFSLPLIREFAEYYQKALPQQYTEGMLTTKYGKVKLYGYIDYVSPFVIHDLKTTRQYAVGNYKKHWQHLVYPYCLMKEGCNIRDFEYNIAEIGKSYYRTYTESYSFKPERDIPRLTLQCEDLINFLHENRDLITDKKIFNLI